MVADEKRRNMARGGSRRQKWMAYYCRASRLLIDFAAQVQMALFTRPERIPRATQARLRAAAEPPSTSGTDSYHH
jgi:hypothetical protein